MKKKLLLILMFVTMFFMGNSNVNALKCQKGDNVCKDTETVKDLLNKELNTKYNSARLACLYEVELSNDKIYYNYIIYNEDSNKLIGGTTANNGEREELRIKGPIFLVGEAYDGLYNKYQCPSKSYIEYSGKWIGDGIYTGSQKEICFDNGDKSDCKSNEKALNTGTNFNGTKDSKKIYDNADAIRYKDLSFKNACKKENLPQEFNKAKTKVCTYYKVNDNGTDYMILLADGTNSTIIHNKSDGERIIVKNGTPKIKDNTVYSDDRDANSYYTSYTNNISANISECPADLYLNFKGTDVETYIGGISQTTNYYYETDQGSGTKQVMATMPYLGCASGVTPNESIYDSCSDLITPELQKIIDYVMTAIRIAVPLLLICLLTYDFALAVFSGDDKIKKIKSKVIKRIIIAIVIFFVPTLINLVFNLVNDVWNKNYSTCGIAQNTE